MGFVFLVLTDCLFFIKANEFMCMENRNRLLEMPFHDTLVSSMFDLNFENYVSYVGCL